MSSARAARTPCGRLSLDRRRGHLDAGVGVPSGVLGFKLAVDPAHPSIVYAATGAGLYRSTDDGQTFTDVLLPTGACAGHTLDITTPAFKDCFLANEVTDVVVQGQANTQTTGANAAPGAVLAAVGWRAGQKTNDDGTMQSPANGVYSSSAGTPGSFKRIDTSASKFAGGDQSAVGRVALGVANGPQQDHRIVYGAGRGRQQVQRQEPARQPRRGAHRQARLQRVQWRVRVDRLRPALEPARERDHPGERPHHRLGARAGRQGPGLRAGCAGLVQRMDHARADRSDRRSGRGLARGSDPAVVRARGDLAEQGRREPAAAGWRHAHAVRRDRALLELVRLRAQRRAQVRTRTRQRQRTGQYHHDSPRSTAG